MEVLVERPPVADVVLCTRDADLSRDGVPMV